MAESAVRQFAPVLLREQNDGKEYFRAVFREFPDMIGGIGDTVSEAIEEAYSMLEVEISFREEEGMSIPSPQVIDLESTPSGRITLRMSKTLHQAVIRTSEEEGVSINSFLNEAIAFYLGHKWKDSASKENYWAPERVSFNKQAPLQKEDDSGWQSSFINRYPTAKA